MRHLIEPTDLSVDETERIIDLALDIIAHREKYSEACKGRKLATLFYEPSTRTRLSFTSAMMELGGNVIGFSDAASSSVSKGETVADTVRVIACFADIIAMRHFKEGAPLVASQYAGIPVINAGDGSHAHPTQTLTDLLTIKRELGRLDDLTIGFCGDLKFGRTVHSLIKALSRRTGIKVILIAPEELRLPDYIRHEVCDKYGVPTVEVRTMEEVMPELDILYMTRVQKERFLDEEEFERALAWTKKNCRQYQDIYNGANGKSQADQEKVWEYVVKMTMIGRDLMAGNPKLAEKGFREEAEGHNAIAGGFQGQRQWTDHMPNGDFMETVLNSSFDWNGIREAFVLATENDALKRELFDVVGMALIQPSRAAQTAEAKAWDHHQIKQFLASRVDQLEQAELHCWELMRRYDRSIRVPRIAYNREFAVTDLKSSIESLVELKRFSGGIEYRREVARTALFLLEKVRKIDPAAIRQRQDNTGTPTLSNGLLSIGQLLCRSLIFTTPQIK